MLNERFANRFNELEAEFLAIPYDDAPYAAARAWRKWATSVKSLLLAACRENSPHYTNFVKLLETCNGHREGIESLGGVFLSAKEAFETDSLFDVERDVSAEILGTLSSWRGERWPRTTRTSPPCWRPRHSRTP